MCAKSKMIMIVFVVVNVVWKNTLFTKQHSLNLCIINEHKIYNFNYDASGHKISIRNLYAVKCFYASSCLSSPYKNIDIRINIYLFTSLFF